MAVVIRLARYGAKKRPFYHIVVTDSRNARNAGDILERVGSYSPMLPRDHADRVKLDADKIKVWMARGAKPSDRVYKFLAEAKLAAEKPRPVQTKKSQPSEKTMKRLEDRAAKLAKAAEAKAAAKTAAEPAPAPAETPTEPVPAETPAEPAADAPATEPAAE
ncbi:MAG: 30S ribosomal protein S16 [Proteobacteria bacterium]|nr:30S ribosomal protein S16 [Pseudomonadota bacterium]